MNDNDFSLTIRKLTLQDSGEYLVFAETDKQLPTKAVTLQVHESLYPRVVIQTDIKLLANHSCSVWLVCNASSYSNLTYTWKRDNEMYMDVQQIHFSLSPAEGDISVTCNASNIIRLAWYTIYIGVSVGGAVVLILNGAVAVFYCRGRRDTAADSV
ncbi:unnamed protein product [Coregonus sp. 'balchen']|nr:unnamed protein product [Coregonus sp. 'balchen']